MEERDVKMPRTLWEVLMCWVGRNEKAKPCGECPFAPLCDELDEGFEKFYNDIKSSFDDAIHGETSLGRGKSWSKPIRDSWPT